MKNSENLDLFQQPENYVFTVLDLFHDRIKQPAHDTAFYFRRECASALPSYHSERLNNLIQKLSDRIDKKHDNWVTQFIDTQTFQNYMGS